MRELDRRARAEQRDALEPARANFVRDDRHHVDQRNAQQRQELRRADVRRDRDDRRHLGAARRRRVDEAVEIARKLVELAGFGERAAVVDIRVRDQHARDAALRLMRGEEPAVVVDRRARPEPADQSENAAFFSAY